MTDPLRRPAAIIFDWDDTLIDNWRAIHAGLNATMDAMGYERWSFEKTKSNVRRSMRDSFPEYFGDRWEEAADVFISNIQQNHLETIDVLDGVPEMLNTLEGLGIYLGVVSNKNGILLREEAEHLQWSPVFGAIVGANDAEKDKPNPAPIYLALHYSGLNPDKSVWYVGDAPSDMECAHRAGVLGVQMVTPEADPSNYADHPPELSFSCATELQKFVIGCT